jgi:hypothetical protein
VITWDGAVLCLAGAASLRDMSDQASAQGTGGFGGTEDSSITEQRSHPAARTTGTAIGSAVGTVLGAVGGPVTAAAGAALGASAGRGLTDLLSGTSSKEQAEIYEQVSHVPTVGAALRCSLSHECMVQCWCCCCHVGPDQDWYCCCQLQQCHYMTLHAS